MILRSPIAALPGRDLSSRPRLQFTEHGFGFFVAILALALVGELLVLRPIVLEPEAPVAGIDVVFALVGGSFAAAGLIAWRRRPDSRTGMLMTATGFAFFVSPLLRQVDGPVAYTVWSLLSTVAALRRARGRQPAAGLPRRGRRARDRPDPAGPAGRGAGGHHGGHRGPLVALVGATAPRAAAERGRRRRLPTNF